MDRLMKWIKIEPGQYPRTYDSVLIFNKEWDNVWVEGIWTGKEWKGAELKDLEESEPPTHYMEIKHPTE